MNNPLFFILGNLMKKYIFLFAATVLFTVISSGCIKKEAKKPGTQDSVPGTEQKAEEEKPKSRSGDYEPKDIDINKVFYFGNKK